MKKRKNSKSKPFRDFLRLASAHDLLGRAGTLMMKKSIRATFWTAGITSSGFLSSFLGLPGFTAAQAIAAPIIIGGGMLAIGAGLTYIPRTLSRRLTAIAEANDLNLMEDYRKSQLIPHLNTLWDNVFFYESDIRYSPGQREDERRRILADKDHIKQQISAWDKSLLERLGAAAEADIDDIIMAVMTEKPISDDIEKSREGFLISSAYALNHALPQSTQAERIGYRLNLFEDHRDGAYFDTSDVKLLEQYIGNSTISDIKADLNFGHIAALKQIPTTFKRDFWFFLITRKVAIATGRAVKYLNDKYQTDIFNSQVLLWPGEEDSNWLRAFENARDNLLEARRQIITGALGEDYKSAVNVLDRMLLPCFELATELRKRFDPEYCDGSLTYQAEDTRQTVAADLESDLKTLDYRPKDIENARRCAEQTHRDQDQLFGYIKTNGHEQILDNKLTLRAVKIAFHTNKNGLKKALLNPKPPLDTTLINAEIKSAAENHQIYSNKLVLLRLHHQLTVLQIQGYRDLARKLAYDQPNPKNAPAGG